MSTLCRIFPSGGTTPELLRTSRYLHWIPSSLSLSSPENFKGGSVSSSELRWAALGGAIPRRVRPRGYRFQRPPAELSEAPPERSEAVPPSESRRAKRGSTEAPPSEARPREGHREVAITKKLKKVPPESPGEPLITHSNLRYCFFSDVVLFVTIFLQR